MQIMTLAKNGRLRPRVIMLVDNCVFIPKGRFSRDTHSILTACVKNAAATLIGAQCPT